MAERITKERLEAFAGWDAPKYSTGVHPNIVEIKKMAAELLAYRESGARESLRKIKQQGEPQRGRDELWSLWRSRVAVWEEACESLERLEAIEK